MPTAGDEGYEKLIICPYDKSHEIRRGRMQFHLDKCRKNFPSSEMVMCCYNASHIVHAAEIQFHEEEDCPNKIDWDRHTHEVGDTYCPVKDLVDVNAAVVPDADENWDNFEAPGSVLNEIKTKAAEKGIVRMMQCESKAKRKQFRQQERLRHILMEENSKSNKTLEDTTSTPDIIVDQPLSKIRTKKASSLQIVRQNPAMALAQISKEVQALDLNKAPESSITSFDTASMNSWSPSEVGSTRSSRQTTLSYASISSHTTPANESSQPSTSKSYNQSLVDGRSTAMMTALSTSQPFSAMFTASSHTYSRPSTAMSIEASVGPPALVSDESGFCQIPIPGLGRGRRHKIKQ